MEERGVKEAEAEILTLLADTVGHFIKNLGLCSVFVKPAFLLRCLSAVNTVFDGRRSSSSL